MKNYYLAIDIGASSGRHILGHIEEGKMILEEINKRIERNERVLITTLTIRMSEELTSYLKELGIKVVSEVEVAYHFLKDKNVQIIGITGSNGKTTTTTLIYNFIKEDSDFSRTFSI